MKCRNVVSVAPSGVASIFTNNLRHSFGRKLLLAVALAQVWLTGGAVAATVVVPQAPANLVAQAVGTNKIRLTWQDKSTNEAGFKIDRALAPTGPWTINKLSIKANAIIYTNTSLKAGTAYYYRIRSYNKKGYSQYSAVAGISTLYPTGVCPFTIAPTNGVVSCEPAQGAVSVSGGTNCNWTATSGASWISIVSGAVGKGNGNVAFTVAANPSTNSRTGSISVAGKLYALTQTGVPECSYAIWPGSASMLGTPSTGSFGVGAPAACKWSAATTDPWITLTSASGSGDGVVNFSVTENTAPNPRTGTITVGGRTFPVTQEGGSLTLGQAVDNSSFTWAHAGQAAWFPQTNVFLTGGSAAQSGAVGNGQSSQLGFSFNGPAAISFHWKVSSESSWDNLTVYVDDIEEATISGEVDWQQKTFHLPEGPHYLTFVYSKDASCCSGGADAAWLDRLELIPASCVYALSPTSASFNSAGGSGALNLTTAVGCSWTASTTDGWIHPAAGLSSGNSLNYSVDSNPTLDARSGTILVGGQPFTITQSGIPCTYTLSPTTLSHGAGQGNGSFFITTPNGCGWAAWTGDSWIHSTSSGAASGTVSYTVDANPGTTSRTGTLTAGTEVFTVVQAGINCSFAIAPANADHSAAAAIGSFGVSATPGCAWGAATAFGWIHTSSSSDGNGTVNYTLDANTSTSWRSGTITAGGQTFTVNQAGVTCSFALNPSSANHSAAAASGSFAVSAPAGCLWGAATAFGWIHTSSSGNSNGTVSYTIDANTSTSTRSGTVTAGGQTFTVTQAGITCTFALNPTTAGHSAAAASGSFGVSAPGGCPWGGSTAFGWIHTSSSGNGNGTVSYTIDANTSTSTRSGTITAGGQIFTVTQAGVTCTFALNPTSASHSAAAASGSFGVSTPGGCPWGAATAFGWIHTSSSGNSNGTVSYTIDANTSTSTRSGTITAGGQTFTVNQAGVTCTFALNPTSFNHNSAASSGSFGVSVLAGCPWGAATAFTWIHPSGNGNANGTVTYTIDANASTSGRSGTITAGGQAFTINQAGNQSPVAKAGADLTVAIGANASFNASGSTDADGSISSYQWDFGDGTTAAGVSTTHSFAAAGIYTVRLTVTDNLGLSASDSALVTVAAAADTTPPSVTLSVSGNPYASGIIALDATALDNVAVTRVEFYLDSSPLVTKTAPPYSINVDTRAIANGAHTFVAKAYDAANNNNSANVPVTVDNQAPTVALTAPANGSTVSSIITLSASANDNTGGSGITKVEFYCDTLPGPIGTATTSPYNAPCDTRTMPNGSHNFYSKAFDAAGNIAASAANTVTVNNTTGGTTPGQLLWVATPASAVNDYARGVAKDGNGNAIVVGDLNGGLMVQKFDGSGTLLWTKQYGSSYGYGVAVDASGNIFVTGYFLGGIDLGGGWLTGYGVYGATFVVKYSPDGSHIWSKGFPNSGDGGGQSIALDGSGNIFLTGYFGGSVDFGGGALTSKSGNSVFLTKLSGATGAHQWSRAFGEAGGGQNAGYSVAVDAAGNAFITGTFLGPINFGGGTLNSLGFDVFVAKFSNSGGHLWSKRFGSDSADYGYCLALSPAGEVYIGGTFRGSIDFGGGLMSNVGSYTDGFLVKLSAAGSFVWSKQYAASAGSADSTRALAVDANGNVLVTGLISGPLDFGLGSISATYNDAFIAKYNAAGANLWAKTFGDYSIDQGNAIVANTDGSIFVAGTWYGTVDFGGQRKISIGGGDSFLVKLAP